MSAASIVDALERRPSEVVLVGDGVALSGGDVLATVAALEALTARWRRDARPRVGLAMSNGPRLAGACLATMATAACAPVDPRRRPDELRSDLRRLDLDGVLVDDPRGSVAQVAAESDLAVIGLQPTGPTLVPELLRAPGRRDRTAAEGRNDEPVLLLGTSGTTAEPKLIGLSEANLLASASAVAATLELGPEDRCLNVMPLFHIHGLVGALLSSVVSGASVECTPGFDAFAFRRQLGAPGITWSTAVPSMYQAMLARGSDAPEPSSLRLLRSSSAPLQPAVWRALEGRLGCPVLNAYGMTEASHQMASNPLPPGERRVGTVGRGAGADVAILAGGVVGRAGGVEGEVVVRGPGLMAGYLAPAGANDAAWVDGWFRTGDLGRLDADGYLTLVGRSKEIINVGGEKVSPFEVEAVVLEHPGVRDAAAFAVHDPLRGEAVGLAVVPTEAGLDAAELRRFARERLSRAKVPERVVLLEAIPLGPTGKVQRVRLPEMLGLRAT